MALSHLVRRILCLALCRIWANFFAAWVPKKSIGWFSIQLYPHHPLLFSGISNLIEAFPTNGLDIRAGDHRLISDIPDPGPGWI